MQNFIMKITLLISIILLYSGCSDTKKKKEKEPVISVVDTNLTEDANLSEELEELNVLNPFKIARIQASDAMKGDYYGASVSIDGDYIVVGSKYKDTQFNNAGGVYLYKKQSNGTVKQIAKIQADNGSTSDYFGSSVSISGDYIIVGAYQKREDGTRLFNAGSAYLFKRNSDNTDDVVQIAEIHADDAQRDDYFGYSVAISGDYIVAGAYEEDTSGKRAGSAYIFKRNSDINITQIAKIQANDAEAYDSFAKSVAIDKKYIIIGSEYENSMGSAYLFKINSDDNITQLAKLQAEDIKPSQYFGSSVSIDDNYIAIGSYKDNDGEGSVYIFQKYSDINITQIAKIQPNDIKNDKNFGLSVAIDGNYVVSGAYQENKILSTDAGSAYIFQINSDSKNDFTEISKIESGNNNNDDNFGYSVSISGNIIVIGAVGEDIADINAGSAYIFDMRPINKPYIYNTPLSPIILDEQFNNKFVYSFDSSSPNGGIINYTLSGLDASSFKFIDNNLSFITTADFENPVDSDINNSYNLTVTATNIDNISNTEDITVKIDDRYYFDLAKLQASDAQGDDSFGYSVSMSGDYIVVGALSAHRTESDAGSVYLYKKQSDGTIIEIAKLEADDANGSDRFGCSVSIDGDYIVVGAWFGETTLNDTNDTVVYNTGSAYLFKINSDSDVTQIAKIQVDDTISGDYFGYKVSMSGDYIAVGAPEQDKRSGSVYIFQRVSDTNVSQIAKIRSNDIEDYDLFGSALSIDDKYIAIGAKWEDTTTGGAGSAYLFKINSDINVTQIAKFQASDAEASDYFGNSISIDGDYIIVGAKDEGWYGSAYLFKRDSDNTNDVIQIAKIIDETKKYGDPSGDNFGQSVSISGDYIAIGAFYDSTKEAFGGSAYIFKRDSDTQITRLTKIEATTVQANAKFGDSVYIDGDYVIVGSKKEDTVAIDSGSVYIFKKDINQVK